MNSRVADPKKKAIIAACHDPRYQVPKGQEVLAIDSRYFRPTEVDLLIGDPTKAKTKLKWEPEYDLKALVKEMVASDIKIMKKRVQFCKKRRLFKRLIILNE